jgi:polysaccharide pyruvyl transferase WcaK-like protein
MNIHSPKILILGFGNVMNFGGEAIVQGTCELIHETWPNATITIATSDIESAKNAITDYSNVTFVIDKPRFTFKRFVKGIFRRLGLGQGEPLHYDLGLIDKHDIFLSVGGDIFVEQISKDISVEVRDLIEMGYKAKRKGKIYCLWGASVGPFSDPEVFEEVARNLRIADLITVREDKGYTYLGSMRCTNMVKVGDPAYMMTPKLSNIKLRSDGEEILIGVNLSRLAMNYIFGVKYTQEDFKKIIASIQPLVELDPRVKIVLIPHVMSSRGGAQDDYLFLSEIKDALNLHEEKVELLPYGLGAQKTKEVMSQCDMVIAARMHCFVGSVSVGTPAIMVAYSDKGYGMTRYAYGDEQWVIGLKELTNPAVLIDKAKQMLAHKEQISDGLVEKREKWKNDARIAINSLAKIYEKNK